MTWFDQSIWVTISVVTILFLIVIFSIVTHLGKVIRMLDIIEGYGDRIRNFKDDRLISWVDKLPISADVITWSRLGLVGGGLFCFFRGHPGFGLAAYTLGWLTDFLDGLKARAVSRRVGHSTRHGKMLDPGIDLCCFTLMTVVLYPFYQPRVIGAFCLMIGARIVLSLVLAIGRRTVKRWQDKLPSDILPKTLSGEAKAALIATSFGLIISNSHRITYLVWAEWLLIAAIILECFSLTHLTYSAWRSVYRWPKLALVPPVDKTGAAS